MITVNNNVKNAYNQSTTQTDRIRINNSYYYINNVEYSDDCYEEGNIFGTAIARILTFEIESSIQMEKKEFQYETGVLINGVFEYISLGNFIVTETEEGDTTDITKVTAMDYMLKTNTIYETNLNYSTATLLDVLQEVCTNCGLYLATTTFTNSSFRVDSNQFEKNTLNRQVIQAVAQVSGCIAKIKADNRLYLINPNLVEDVSQVFTLKEYAEADIKRLTHPLNLVSLTNSQIEGENITLRDETSIAQNGENALIINDNPFAYNQDKRTQLITPLFNAVKGFEYKSYSFKFQMLPWIETLDKIQFLDKEGNTYNSYVFRFTYKSPNGVESTIESPSETRATIAYQNIPDALEIAKRTEILVDKQNQIIESVVSNVTSQNNKISQVQQTVNELNSKISDIADITTSQESNSGSLTFEDINESEPIHIEIMPLGDNISYLYPFEQLYPSDNLYIKLRTLRFTNTETNEVFDYELPDDLLFYDNEHYDKFVLDYDSQTCYINKKCAYDNNGNVICLADEVINSYTFPHINLTDGDYTVQILKYDNVPYGAYLFCRLMAQNIYTTQFAIKAEVNSEISQAVNKINAVVSEKVGKNEIIAEMNLAIEDEQAIVKFKGNKVIIESDYFKLYEDGSIEARNGKFSGDVTIGADDTFIVCDGNNIKYITLDSGGLSFFQNGNQTNCIARTYKTAYQNRYGISLKTTNSTSHISICHYDEVKFEYSAVDDKIYIYGLPYIEGTANGTLFGDAGLGITVENGLITRWNLEGATGTLFGEAGNGITVKNGLITNWSIQGTSGILSLKDSGGNATVNITVKDGLITSWEVV